MIPHTQDRHFRIAQAARLSGVTAASIRYYEREGLLQPQPRGENGYRLYSGQDIHTLRFIRLCRSMDMSLDEVRTLLALQLNSPQDCNTARQTLDAHLGHVRQRLKELRALEKDLHGLRIHCNGNEQSCTIIEALHQRADTLARSGAGSGKKDRHV